MRALDADRSAFGAFNRKAFGIAMAFVEIGFYQRIIIKNLSRKFNILLHDSAILLNRVGIKLGDEVRLINF